MRLNRAWKVLAPTAMVTALVSCEAVRSPVAIEEPNARVQPMCQLGCQEVDPDPDWPGYFLTSLVTPAMCFGGNDSDGDGLANHCEDILTATFAPQITYTTGDNIAREPHWVAKRNLDYVLIGYLLSYYRDEGSTSWLCNLPPPLWHWSCEGHNGDSEALFLQIYYDAEHQHWILDRAWYSQHGNLHEYPRGPNDIYPTSLFYPNRAGGYPRSYVSVGKHANYSNKAECRSGGAYGTDDCPPPVSSVRVESQPWLNIGSRQVPLLDCMSASNPGHPYYGSGAQECYWTDLEVFRGWYPEYVGGPASAPYSAILFLASF